MAYVEPTKGKPDMSPWLENVTQSTSSYFIAFVGMASTEALMFALGFVALLIRVAYDSIRLFRYIKNPDHKG